MASQLYLSLSALPYVCVRRVLCASKASNTASATPLPPAILTAMQDRTSVVDAVLHTHYLGVGHWKCGRDISLVGVVRAPTLMSNLRFSASVQVAPY